MEESLGERALRVYMLWAQDDVEQRRKRFCSVVRQYLAANWTLQHKEIRSGEGLCEALACMGDYLLAYHGVHTSRSPPPTRRCALRRIDYLDPHVDARLDAPRARPSPSHELGGMWRVRFRSEWIFP